jgi:Fe2+ or Zn2+ uptake regulation protein
MELQERNDDFISRITNACRGKNSKDLKPDDLAELRSRVVRLLLDRDHDGLDAMHLRLASVALLASRWLAVEDTALWVRLAAELPGLAAGIQCGLFLLEKVDAKDALMTIRYGKDVLSALMAKGEDVTLEDLVERAGTTMDGKRLSTATISRTLALLEEAGFIERQGATMNRRYRVLDKAKDMASSKPLLICDEDAMTTMILKGRNAKQILSLQDKPRTRTDFYSRPNTGTRQTGTDDCFPRPASNQ